VKTKALALVLFVAGVCASFALADDGHGKGKKDAAAPATTATGTTKHAEPAEPADGEQHGKGKDKAHGAAKVTFCHRAGHSGRWVKIRVSSHAAKAHTRHGDVAPDASGNCPAAPAATTTNGSTTTDSTTTSTTTSTNP
jgi:hypothetical protein